MILSERRQPVETAIPKFEYSDEEFNVRRKSNRPTSPRLQAGVQDILDDENNDDVERLARRKSRLLEPHPASANSPCTSGMTVRRRAEAAAPRGISQAQIGEHYGNCIRLAAENKITAKNAFNLHLIDYMSDMLKKEDYASFQIASSSLDAGAKIYAGRVDAVHQETYQVLTGLGRSDKPPTTGDDVDSQEGSIDVNTVTTHGKPDQRKKPQVHRDILQKQLNRIRSKTLAAKADVDPLFQHQTATYDEGGTAELRLNQLCSLDESCVLILDSSTPVMQVSRQLKSNHVDVKGLLEFIQPLLPKFVNQLSLCSSLQDFRFTNWKMSDDSNPVVRSSQLSPPACDVNDTKVFPFDADDDHFSDQAINDDTLLNIPHEPMNEIVLCGSSEDSLAPQTRDNDNNVAIEEPSRPDVSRTATEGDLFVSSLKSMLDKQYEHFGQINDHILGMWAGPEHWRKKAKRRRFDPVTGLEITSGFISFNDDLDVADDKPSTEPTQAVGKSRRSRRTKRNAPVVDYESAKEPSENRTRNGHLARKTWIKTELSEGVPRSAASNATLYKEATRLKASRQMNLLPSEWVDTRNTLYQLYNREVILGSHPGLYNNQLPVAFDAAETDNLALPHNNPEFCAVVNWLDKPPLLNAATDTLAVSGAHLDDVDGPQGSPVCIVDDDDEDDLPLPFEFTATQPANTQGDFGDLDLIFQPRKVARIEIGYARTAKMINVGRLKSAMWNFLELAITQTNVAPPSPVSVASTSSAPEAASLPASLTGEAAPNPDFPELPFVDPHRELHDERRCSDHCSPPRFSDLIGNLPTRLSWQMTKELSVPIVLSCLLHLANEKELYLSGSEDLTDIIIFQGVPYFELETLKTYQPARGYGDSDCDSVSKRTPRPAGPKQKKVKRPRSSTLDSWLIEPDSNGAHSPR
ncbi:hypothetical protein AHF37_02816 [Paragonimus kellicotti]|nr:hypothetical protein AHF37_02816 [Paragonimus kellicotti]